MVKHRISEMSWREVRAALASQPVVLIPLGSTVAVYFDMEEISPNGSMGDSTVAPADKKRAILEAVVDGCAAFVERLKQMNARPMAGPGTLS